MILMPQIFDVITNENARYKRNELECSIHALNVRFIMYVKRTFYER